MNYRLTPDLLREIEDPHVTQAILDTLNWSPDSLIYNNDGWPGVLPANENTLYGKSAGGAAAVALATTDPTYLDRAARDGRITVREAVLSNPACTQAHALLIAERASRRSSAQAQLLSTAIEKYLTPRQALDIINDDRFNPSSVDRDLSLGKALTGKILQDPDYVALLQEATAGIYSGRFVTEATVAEAAACFQRGGVSGALDAFSPEEADSDLIALSWFGAAATKAPESITPQDVERAYLPGIAAGKEWSPAISGISHNVNGLPTHILKMMWVPEVVNLPSVGSALFATVGEETRDDIADVLDLAVRFCEGISDEALNEMPSKASSTYGIRSPRRPQITPLWNVPRAVLGTELLTRLREVALRYKGSDGRHLKRFVESVVSLPEEVLASLPADFLDPVLDVVPWGSLETRSRDAFSLRYQASVTAWAKGELPLKPTASALAAVFRGSTTPFWRDTTGAKLLESTVDEAFVAGIEAAGAAAGKSPKAVARTFNLFFGGCTEAWKIGLTLLGDNQGEDEALSLTAIAATACALSGIEPAYLQEETTEDTAAVEAPEMGPEPADGEERGPAPELEPGDLTPLDENSSPEDEETDTPAGGDDGLETGITTVGEQFGFAF